MGSYTRSTCRLVVLVVVMLAFVVLGGLVFRLLEAEGDINLRRHMRRVRREFYENYTCIAAG